MIVAARVRREGFDGLGLFVVEDGMAGYQKGRKLNKIGRLAQDTAELFFDDVEVARRTSRRAGEGLHYLMRNLAQERLSIASSAVASAERALEITLDYVRERNAFGRPIGTFQANRFALAELATETSFARRTSIGASRRTASASCPTPTRPVRSSSRRNWSSGGSTGASSSTAATATWRSTRSRGAGVTRASRASTAARARS